MFKAAEQKPEPIPDIPIWWMCACKTRNLNHCLTCAACGDPRPAPPKGKS